MKITINTEEFVDVLLKPDEYRKEYLYGMFLAMITTSWVMPDWLEDRETDNVSHGFKKQCIRDGWNRGVLLVTKEREKLSKKAKAGKASASKRWVLPPAKGDWTVDGRLLGKLIAKEEKFEA